MGAMRGFAVAVAAFGLGLLVGSGGLPHDPPPAASAPEAVAAAPAPEVRGPPASSPSPAHRGVAVDDGPFAGEVAIDARDGLVLRFEDPRGECGHARIEAREGWAGLVRFGTWTRFHENGVKDREVVYGRDGEIAPGSVERFWYPSGAPAVENHYGPGGDRISERHWYENGQLALESSFRDGAKVGVHATFYESGQAAVREEYDDEGRPVRKTEWHENGQLAAVTSYDSEGHETGLFVRFHDNGVKYAEGRFPTAAGDVTHWVYRDRAGNTTDEGDFYCSALGTADVKHGVWTEYRPDGTAKSRVRYERGTVVEVLPVDK